MKEIKKVSKKTIVKKNEEKKEVPKKKNGTNNKVTKKEKTNKDIKQNIAQNKKLKNNTNKKEDKNNNKVKNDEKLIKFSKYLNIFLIILGILIILFVLFSFADRKTDHSKIDKISLGCRLLGESHVLEKMTKEKTYYVYETRMYSSYSAPALEKKEKGKTKYWAPKGWKLKDKTRSITFDEDVRIVSDKKDLSGWKLIGKYIPTKEDRIFIYKLPPTSVSYGDRYIIGDYTVMYSGLDEIEYIGILNEENIQKYASKLFINAVFTSDNSFNKNHLQVEK